jgi:hypothetical protein
VEEDLGIFLTYHMKAIHQKQCFWGCEAIFGMQRVHIFPESEVGVDQLAKEKDQMGKSHHGISVLEPAVYRIRVQGILDKNLSDYYRGMTIEHVGDPKQDETTILMGRVVDQSALIGVLNSLYNTGYPILLVEYLASG